MDNPTQPVASQEPALGNGECLSLALDLTGTVLGDFHVLRRLGEGGMGQVYLAEQRSLKRPIALKILKVDRAENPNSLKRFKTEAEAVARAIHPNIVQVYSIGDQDGLHFMALEYVDGLNLREYLAKKGPPNLSLALSIMRQGAAALQAAAELGIIHRDIKPDNILLTRKGAVKVTDFGLSRFAGDRPSLNLTQSGVAMGTPLYMSPEQVEGKSLDPRTDIYSFGVTCYHMLAGQPPFRGQTAFEVALQHVQADPEPLEKIRPDLPPELCGLIHKMMAKQPDQRFATAREILKELARIRVGLTGSFTVSNPLPVDPAVSDLMPTISSPTLSERVAAAALREGTSSAGKKAGGKQVGLALFTVLLALVGGAWAGWHSSPSSSSATDSDNAKAIEDTETLLRGFQKRRELHLQDAVKVYANPPNGQVHVGLRYHLELGMLYLDQWRLDEADGLFLGMMNNPKAVKEYVTIGKLGHAMILAFPRDNTSLGEKYEESTQLFLELVRTKDKGLAKLHWLINRHPGFLQMLARALEYDAANYKAANLPFPKELEDYRKTRPLPQKPNQPKSGGANNKKT